VRTSRAVFPVVLLGAVLFWVGDSVLDWLVFYKGEGTLWELSVSNVPAHELYIRSLAGAIIVALGVVVSRLMARQERAQEAVRESEAKYRTLVEQLPAVTYVAALDETSTTLYISPQIEPMLGFSTAEYAADPDIWRQQLHPDDRERVLAQVAQSRATGEPFNSEYRMVTRDGQVVWFHDQAKLVRDEGGNPLFLQGVMLDITERRQAEQAVRESEAELTAIYESAPVAIILVDHERRVRKANVMAADFTGRPQDELIGLRGGEALRCVRSLDDPRGCGFGPFCDVCPVRNSVLDTFRTGRAHRNVEAAIPVLRGEEQQEVHLLVSTVPLTLAGQQMVLVTLDDITERKRAEAAAADLARFPSENPSPVMRVREDGTVLYGNAASESLLSARACGVGEVVSGEWGELTATALRSGSRQETDVEHQGRIISFVIVPVGEAGYVNWYGRDMTEGRRAEEQARRQTAVLAAINEVFGEALTCETEEDLGRTCLAVAERLTGSKFGYLAQLNPAGLLDNLAISDPGWDACEMAVSDARRSIKNMPIRGFDRSTIREGKSRIVNADEMATHPARVGTPEGHPQITAFLGVPLKHEGKTIGMIGLGNKEPGYTVADQEAVENLAVAIVQALRNKRAEDAVRKARDELEERVERRTAQLAALNAELASFSHSVSHDLRAPLRAAEGFGRALLEDCADALDEQGKHYVDRIRAGCRRMSELIEDLLRLSRVTAAEMSHGTVDLSQMAREVAAELRKGEPKRRVKFTIADGLVTEGDSGLLRLLLEHLLRNAWKFTSKHPTARIELGATDGDDGRAFFVRDDGAGFDMAYAHKLFAPFQRLHSQDEFPGTGIGLATVQRIVRRHGGRVWFEAAVEQGATFYFTL